MLARQWYNNWIKNAGSCLSANINPEEIRFTDDAQIQASLFGIDLPDKSEPNLFKELVKQDSDFELKCKRLAAHRNPDRWNVLYRICYRIIIQNESNLHTNLVDPDIFNFDKMAMQVGKDAHQIKAFLRFKKITAKHEDQQFDLYTAHYKPDHRILSLSAHFFSKRFAPMFWAIFTPDESAFWNTRELFFDAGVPENRFNIDDPTEILWKTYYRSAFIEQRKNEKCMTRLLPRRFWKNLPESEIIEQVLNEQKNE